MRTVVKLFKIFCSLLSLALLVRFLLRVFEPGYQQSAQFFQATKPVLDILDMGLSLVTLPVAILADSLAQIAPVIAAWFPRTAAAPLADQGLDLLFTLIPGLHSTSFGKELAVLNVTGLFPGMLDWTLILSMLFLGLVEAVVLGGLNMAEQQARRQRKKAFDEQIVEGYRQLDQRSSVTDKNKSESKNPLIQQIVRDLKTEISGLHGKVHVDALTQLFNKGYLIDTLKGEMILAKQGYKWLSVILLDVDNFKRINDNLGHAFGDQVLVHVARVLSQTKPSTGRAIACRYGGEEMVLILVGCDADNTAHVAEMVRQGIQDIRFSQMPELRISASLGAYAVCFMPTNGSHELDCQTMINKADAEMYKAKKSGKNRVSLGKLP